MNEEETKECLTRARDPSSTQKTGDTQMEGTEPDPHQRSQLQYTEYRLEGTRLEDLALYSAIPLEQRKIYSS